MKWFTKFATKILYSVILLFCIIFMIFKQSAVIRSENSDQSEVNASLIEVFATIAAIPPTVEENTSCRPKQLPRFPSCQNQTGLTGELLKTKRKIVLMILFSFEVDTLEIALREQQDLVDKIFIVESSISHKREPKPLVWERVKFSKRFDFVNPDKIMHVVANDEGTAEWSDNEWSSEYSQTDIGVQRVRDWAASSGSLADEDLFITADVDEILSQSTLQQLQWCQTSAEVISGAIWMPLGNLKNAYRSAFAVADMPHMFGMPTIYKWGSFMAQNMSGRRLFDRYTKYVTGGIHLTNSAFLPTALLKELTATEGGYYNGFVNLAFLFDMTVKEMEEEQERLYTHHYRSCWKPDIDPVENSVDVRATLPWFLECNPKRFPYWFGNPDRRYQKMLDIIDELRNKFKFPEQNETFRNLRKLFKRYFFANSKNKAACNIMEIRYTE